MPRGGPPSRYHSTEVPSLAAQMTKRLATISWRSSRCTASKRSRPGPSRSSRLSPSIVGSAARARLFGSLNTLLSASNVRVLERIAKGEG
jgi:hypothetical protein